jgi:glycosyltransferase involved in cell wall biosynthesis
MLLSDAEGLSNFLLEAMACGVASITTAAAAVSPTSVRQAWSWIVGENDNPIDEALRTLVTLQQDSASYRAKGQAARRKIEESFAMDQIASTYEQLYQRLQTLHKPT